MTEEEEFDDENMGKSGLRNWIDHEGGVYSIINGYGLTIEYAIEVLELKNVPQEIIDAWHKIEESDSYARQIMRWVEGD